jgi:hypothetical protein
MGQTSSRVYLYDHIKSKEDKPLQGTAPLSSRRPDDDAHIASGDVILAVLARRRQPVAPPSITTPDALRLKIEPTADCGRYDGIRKIA